MIKKKTLIVASYPVKSAQHGGQKRLQAVMELYRSIFLEVKFVGVFHRTAYDKYEESDLLIGQPDIIRQIEKQPYAIDIITGQAIDKDIHVRSPMAKLLMEYKPDIIHIEQPFCYLGLKPLLKELNMRPRLVFGSQNIEYRMKEEIYNGLKLSKQISQSIVRRIRELETEFSRDADLVIAVSEEDAKEHYKMGAKKCAVAPNGIERIHASESVTKKWQDFNKYNAIEQSLVFVGSAHPPNWMGFLEMLGEDLTFLPESSKILLVGGVSEYFSDAHVFSTPDAKWQFNKRALSLGKLNDYDLAGVLASSDTILLPINGGGGSNLKTAEAILSDKKIVATSFAFRGYEEYKQLPNIYIADSSKKFISQINMALSRTTKKRTSSQQKLAEQVQWKYTLKPIEKHIKRLARQNIVKQTRRMVREAVHRTRNIIQPN